MIDDIPDMWSWKEAKSKKWMTKKEARSEMAKAL